MSQQVILPRRGLVNSSAIASQGFPSLKDIPQRKEPRRGFNVFCLILG